MKTLNRFLIRLRNLVTGRRGDQRLREELEDYVAREAEANIQAGMSEEEARRQARMKLGAAEAIREQYHAEEGLPLLECLAQDTRFSLRQMRRSLGFTLVVVLTMALGIAATTTMFTVVYSTLLRSLPYPQSERIVAIHDTRIAGRSAGGLMTGPRFYDIEARNRSFSSLAFFYFDESTLIAGKKLPIYVRAAGANAGFWDVFDTAPMLGRVFNAKDDVPHAPQIVVLSYPGWQRLFGGDPNVIGEQVTLDQQTVTIVGVMPRDFSAPGGVDLWHAAQFVPNNWGNDRGDGLRNIIVFGRLRRGVTPAQAQGDLDRIGEQLRREYPSSDGAWRFTSETLREDRYGHEEPALVALLIASALLLLIACINVANLLLSRATARQREVALRRALGASGRRVAFQLLVESGLLALAGGGTGILLAFVLTRTAATSLPGILGRPGTIHMDGIVIGIALLISLATGIVFGVVPVLETRKVQLHSALKQGEARLGGSSGNWLRSVLVGVQVGLSLVLLVGASLLAESLWNLMKQPLGFEPEHLLTFRLVLPWNTRPEAVRNFYDDVQQRIENLPGVEAAGQISSPPMTDFHVRGSYDADWLPQVANQPAISAENRNIAGNLLGTMGTPLLAGKSVYGGGPGFDTATGTGERSLGAGVSAEGKSNRTSPAPEWRGARDRGGGCRCARGIGSDRGGAWTGCLLACERQWRLASLLSGADECAAGTSRKVDPRAGIPSGPAAVGRRDRDDGSATKRCCGATTAERSGGCVICRDRIAAGLRWNLWSGIVFCCAAHAGDWRPDGTRSDAG